MTKLTKVAARGGPGPGPKAAHLDGLALLRLPRVPPAMGTCSVPSEGPPANGGEAQKKRRNETASCGYIDAEHATIATFNLLTVDHNAEKISFVIIIFITVPAALGPTEKYRKNIIYSNCQRP